MFSCLQALSEIFLNTFRHKLESAMSFILPVRLSGKDMGVAVEEKGTSVPCWGP